VVDQTPPVRIPLSNHPVCANEGAARFFLSGAATPPGQEGRALDSTRTALKRTLHRAERTKYAAISRLRTHHRMAVGALVEIETKILRDDLTPGIATGRTSNERLHLYRFRPFRLEPIAGGVTQALLPLLSSLRSCFRLNWLPAEQ